MNNMHESDELAFDAVINQDSKPQTLLPVGDYKFTVLDYKQGEYTQKDTGQVKKKVTVIIGIDYQGEQVQIQESLPLLKSMEWKFCTLFTSIGDRKHGQPLQMDWTRIHGKMGMCSIKHEQYTNKYGEKATSAKVDKFLEPKEQSQLPKPTFTQPTSKPVQQPVQQAQSRPATNPEFDKPWDDQF